VADAIVAVADEIAEYANAHGTALKQAAVQLGHVSAEEYDTSVIPRDDSSERVVFTGE